MSPAGERSCARIAEAVSARIDGEDPGMEPAIVDAHLRRCARCRAFEARVRAQHRRLRVRTATPVPDLSARILPAVPAGPSPRPRPTVRAGAPRLGAPTLGAAALLVALVLLAGYLIGSHLGRTRTGDNVALSQITGSSQADPAYPGATVLPASEAVGKPDIILTDTDGHPYDMATATAGRVTLLYLGYTHCPDVCPVNVALAAEAVHGLAPAEREKVTVVFITTDPARDSPAVIKAWLGRFTAAFPGDPAFVGLTAPEARIHEAERQIRMLLSHAGPSDSGTAGPSDSGTAGPSDSGTAGPSDSGTDIGSAGYNVVHAGYTLVYGPDGLAHLQVTETETPVGYTTTLRHLIQKGFVAR